MPVSPNKSLRIRDTCLELAMTLKDPDKIRVKFLDLAYYFEPIFQKKQFEKYSKNTIDSYILDQWKIILTLIDQVHWNTKNTTSSKTMLNVLQYQMKSYTDTLSQSKSNTAHKHHKSRLLPTVIHTIQPTNYGTNPTRKGMYPVISYPRNIWRTRNELASQERTSDLADPVDQVRPCRCAGCRCRGCECCNSCGQDGRCRCAHDAVDAVDAGA